jgi:predicted transcriptional regulator
MRTAQPNFMSQLLAIADKLFSVVTSKVARKRTLRTERVIRWFEKNGDELVGEARLEKVELSKLQKLFNVSEGNPMYDCYPIKTKRQIRYIRKAAQHPIDSWSYDYFLECDAF